MENKKYEFTGRTREYDGHTLHQIRALKDFDNDRAGHIGVKAGDIGGWIESEKNLSTEGKCWIYDDSKVFEDAVVSGISEVRNQSVVYGQAKISEGSLITRSHVFEEAIISGFTKVNDSSVRGQSKISGFSDIDHSWISEHAQISGSAKIFDSNIEDHAQVNGNAILTESCADGYSTITDHTDLCGVNVTDQSVVDGKATVWNVTLCGETHVGESSNINAYSNYSHLKDCSIVGDSVLEMSTSFNIKHLSMQEKDHLSVDEECCMFVVNKNGEEIFFEQEYGSFEAKVVSEEMVLLDDKYSDFRDYLEVRNEVQETLKDDISKNVEEVSL